MPVLAHLHQLFNAEQCQAYLHGHWGTYHYRPRWQTLRVP